MFQARAFVAIFIATLAVSAAAAGSASADWYVNGVKLSASQSAAIATTASVDSSIILRDPSEELEILCKEVTYVNYRIIGPNKDLAEAIIFHGCMVLKPSGCEVPDLIEWGHSVSTATATKGVVKDLMQPATGNILAELSFSGTTCAIAGEKPLTGQVTEVLPSGETEQATHTFEGQGSVENHSLEIAGHPAYLLGAALLQLASGSKWSFH